MKTKLFGVAALRGLLFFATAALWLVGVAAVKADILTLLATPHNPDQWTPFFIDFNDAIGDRLFEPTELIAFSGVQEIGSQFYSTLVDTPTIPGFTAGLTKMRGSFIFTEPAHINGLSINYATWSYETLPPAPSPAPGPVAGAGLPGVIVAAVGLLGWWRRERKAPNWFPASGVAGQ